MDTLYPENYTTLESRKVVYGMRRLAALRKNFSLLESDINPGAIESTYRHLAERIFDVWIWQISIRYCVCLLFPLLPT